MNNDAPIYVPALGYRVGKSDENVIVYLEGFSDQACLAVDYMPTLLLSKDEAMRLAQHLTDKASQL